MMIIDMAWRRNKDWWHWEDGHAVINEDAPPEAQESYKNYIDAVQNKTRYI